MEVFVKDCKPDQFNEWYDLNKSLIWRTVARIDPKTKDMEEKVYMRDGSIIFFYIPENVSEEPIILDDLPF